MDIKTIKTWVHSVTRDLNHNGNFSSVYLFNSNNIFFLQLLCQISVVSQTL